LICRWSSASGALRQLARVLGSPAGALGFGRRFGLRASAGAEHFGFAAARKYSRFAFVHCFS
jgi:hypothetical protein